MFGWTEPASAEMLQEKQFANTSTHANDLTVQPVHSGALNQKFSMPVLQLKLYNNNNTELC